MKSSRLVEVVHGGQAAHVAWRSLRTDLAADLERDLRRRGRWPAIVQLLDDAIDRAPSREVDAYLVAAGHLLRKLARSTDRPVARATCRGLSAALSIRLGDAEAARKPIRQSIEALREAIAADERSWRAGRRRRDHDDVLYRRRYLGNEVMALQRYLAEELVVVEVVEVVEIVPARPVARAVGVDDDDASVPVKGRASIPSWDDILFGVTRSGAR